MINKIKIYALKIKSMKELLILLVFSPFLAHSQEKIMRYMDYAFIGQDGELKRFEQIDDTLYHYHSRILIDAPVFAENPKMDVERSYKIIASDVMDNFVILKLERLDSVPLSSEPFPPDRFFVHVIKKTDNNQIGYLNLHDGLTLQQLNNIQLDIAGLKKQFYWTYFNNNYWQTLSYTKAIETKEDADKILNFLKNDRIKELSESYKNSQVKDLYGSGFISELLNKACITLGYNPIGASKAIKKWIK